MADIIHNPSVRDESFYTGCQTIVEFRGIPVLLLALAQVNSRQPATALVVWTEY
ncbi:MAG: hypothetical protein RIG63_27415 [Coleofasciculus chthonoplastes F3-SA18-01]|uniref:hypothetical protein n=1 Tax=Coleofasciculus chthonoplastes TaxID=64178 RepID=UPI0033045BF8